MRLAEELQMALAPADDLVCIEADEELAHALEEAAKGEKRAGHKYVRREGPFKTKSGKMRYRYYYKTSAAARAARAGAEVRLGRRTAKIEKVAPDGSVTMTIDGSTRTIPSDAWANLLRRHYGKAFTESAERRAHQAINAVLKHVPKAMLKDLRGSTDEERLKDLQSRAPEVYSKLQGSFQRAGVGPFEAKRVIDRTLRRRGWEPEARAAVIGSVITENNRGYRQTIAASENLAGGGTVTARHVGAVMELRNPPGKSFSRSVVDTAAAAEKELAKLSEAISAAQKSGNPEMAANALALAFNSPSMRKLNLMAQAFPGLRDKAIGPSRDTMSQAVSVAPDPNPKTDGAATSVYVAGEGGQPKALNAKYRLVEADQLIPSHNPFTFNRHKDYPEGVQERVYHRDKAEQAKVTRNAQKMIPQLLVNTNPDAVNGPPLIRKDGVVLGGNSRVMSMQLAARDYKEKSAELRKYLSDHAHEVGLRPEDVAAMKNPILVREVENPGETKEDLRRTVRQMNESFTQGMDPRTMQVAMGTKLTDDTMAALGDDMAEDETLNQFLASGRSERFVNALHKAGVIDQRNASQYLQKGTNLLNHDGRVMVSRILTGRMVGDADMLSETRPKMVENIAMSVPAMERAKTQGEKYDISGDLRTALDAYNDLTRQVDNGSIPPLDSKMSDRSFNVLMGNFRQLPGIGETHPVVDNDRARTLLEVLIRKPGPQMMSKVFRDYARKAAQHPEGQATMFGAPPSPETMLRNAAFGGKEKQPELPLAASQEPPDNVISLMDRIEEARRSRQLSAFNQALFNLLEGAGAEDVQLDLVASTLSDALDVVTHSLLQTIEDTDRQFSVLKWGTDGQVRYPSLVEHRYRLRGPVEAFTSAFRDHMAPLLRGWLPVEAVEELMRVPSVSSKLESWFAAKLGRDLDECAASLAEALKEEAGAAAVGEPRPMVTRASVSLDGFKAGFWIRCPVGLTEAALPMKGKYPHFQIRGDDHGQWELGAYELRALKDWDWVANAALSHKNDGRTLMVDGATEHNAGFRKAMKAAIKKYPDLVNYLVAFDGPLKPLADLLGAKVKQDWDKIVFYHGTSTASWPSIQKRGLKPRGEKGAPVYGATTGAAPGRPDAVYLTTQRNTAAFAARDAARATKSDMLVLRIQGLKGERMLPDEDSREKDPWVSMMRLGSVAYRGTIPPRLIKKA